MLAAISEQARDSGRAKHLDSADGDRGDAMEMRGRMLECGLGV